ncbi:MAG: prepilin-type N-terminal cleavage/methylation domain-containing protein [Phycisphaerales bacterium JB039]
MRRGVTLIETLAAVALLGLVGSLLAVGLGGAGDAARIAAAVSAVRDLDQRARVVSESAAPATLRRHSNGRLLIETASPGGEVVIMAERWAPKAVHLTLWTLSGDAVDAIRFDRRGRSLDYRVDIAAAEWRISLTVSGMTGWIEEAP